MNSKLKELIQPYWVEEQQGVYIPLIDKVLLKNNIPEMPYGDYMEDAKSNGVQIATKDELLQMYLQKDEINKILREHNGDMLDAWYGSSSEYGLYYEWFVDFGSGYCYYATKLNYSASRAVVDLKSKTNNKTMEQFNLAEYLKNPNRKIVTRDGRPVRIICTDRKGSLKHPHPIVALVQIDDTEPIYDYTADGSYTDDTQSLRDLFFVTEKQESPLKKGDRVLVRNYDNESWRPRIFSSYDSYDKECKYKYECDGDDDKYIQCIPYNEHTWKLLGTTDEYKEENMKQFNLEEYLKAPNKKVVTRDGRNVRIICTDRQGGDRPILILCFESDGIERCFSCLPNGRRYVDIDSCMDLFFAPEKHEGWVNLFNLPEGTYLGRVYSSKEVAEAMSKKCGLQYYIATIKIEWEE